MSEPNIVMSRIDNRLVHGQVGVTWVNYLRANLLLIADDEVVNDTVQQDIMKLTAETYNVGIRFFTIAHTAEIIRKAAPSQRIFIITKTPQAMLALIEQGVPIKEVNVGNMHFSEGKRQISFRVFVDDADLEALRAIKARVERMFFQDVPSAPVEKVEI